MFVQGLKHRLPPEIFWSHSVMALIGKKTGALKTVPELNFLILVKMPAKTVALPTMEAIHDGISALLGA